MTNGKRGPKKQYKYQVTVRLETADYEYLKARAEGEGVPIADILRELVRAQLDAFKEQPRPPGRPKG